MAWRSILKIYFPKGLVGYSFHLMPLMISLYKDKYLQEIEFLSKIFSLFIVDQRDLDENVWMLNKRSKGGMTLDNALNLPFWRYEQFVDIENEIAEEERSSREEQEGSQTQGINPSSYLNQMSSMANKFKP